MVELYLILKSGSILNWFLMGWERWLILDFGAFLPHNKIGLWLKSSYRWTSPILGKIGGNTSRICPIVFPTNQAQFNAPTVHSKRNSRDRVRLQGVGFELPERARMYISMPFATEAWSFLRSVVRTCFAQPEFSHKPRYFSQHATKENTHYRAHFIS